jgi:hypothetical protein
MGSWGRGVNLHGSGESCGSCPGANVIKLFTAAIYESSSKARMFVHGRLFQPGLMFVVKAGAYLSEAGVPH